MARNKRTPAQRERDLVFITRLYLQQIPLIEIADRLNEMTKEDYTLSYNQVISDVRKIRERWQQQALDNIDERINQELDKIDAVEAEAYESWRKSKQTKVTVTTKRVPVRVAADGRLYIDEQGRLQQNDEGAVQPLEVEQTVKHEQSSGDPRFLQIVLHCIHKRAELLGLDKPKKIAPTDPTGKLPYKLKIEKPEEYESRRIEALSGILEQHGIVISRRARKGKTPLDSDKG